MRKNLFAVLVGGILLSSSALAVTIPSGTDITTTDCTLLGSAIRINLSANVVGAYECDTAATTVVVAACHTAGSRASKSLTCVNSAATGEAADWNNAACATAGVTTFTGVGFTGYKASSAGGGVGGVDLNGACTQGEIEGQL